MYSSLSITEVHLGKQTMTILWLYCEVLQGLVKNWFHPLVPKPVVILKIWMQEPHSISLTSVANQQVSQVFAKQLALYSKSRLALGNMVSTKGLQLAVCMNQCIFAIYLSLKNSPIFVHYTTMLICQGLGGRWNVVWSNVSSTASQQYFSPSVIGQCTNWPSWKDLTQAIMNSVSW